MKVARIDLKKCNLSGGFGHDKLERKTGIHGIDPNISSYKALTMLEQQNKTEHNPFLKIQNYRDKGKIHKQIITRNESGNKSAAMESIHFGSKTQFQ